MAATNPGLTNLVSWWPLDEESGTRYDSHGSNDLTDGNTVLYGTGVRGNAADFETTNSEYLTIVDNESLSPSGNEAFSIGCWVKLETQITQEIIAKLGAAGSRSYSLLYTNGTGFQFRVSNDGTSLTTVTETTVGAGSAGTWYFVTGYHDPDADVIGIQVNNNTADTQAHATGVFDSAAAFSIGRNAAGAYADALVDIAFFYDQVIDADNHEWLYNSGAGRLYAEVIGFIPRVCGIF